MTCCTGWRRASPNLVLSPSSIATLLAMLEPGAGGPTEAGIAQALGSGAMSPQQQALAWHALNATLGRQAGHDHVALDTANELWLEDGFPVRSSYLALLAGDFAAGVKEQDLDGTRRGRPAPSTPGSLPVPPGTSPTCYAVGASGRGRRDG